MTVEKQRGHLCCEDGPSHRFPVGMRVLAVDDDPICLKVLENLLRKCQYHVTTANQAIEALRMLRENKNKFDLVISDVNMPDMDGFKLLEFVGLEMDLPVIMLSAHGDTKMVMKGVTRGACDYLLKPVRIEELKNIWQHVVRRKNFDSRDQNKASIEDKAPNTAGEGSQGIMYPSSSLLGGSKDEAVASISIDELIEKADGFAGVFPEHKYEIVKRLQDRKHICGMTGDGVNDAPALKKADIGIAVADATDAARGASDIVLTEPGLSVIISAVLTSKAIFQRMKNYTIYAVSITMRIVLGFLLVALIWEFDFSPFMVLIIAILNGGTIMTISKDRVKPSPVLDSWKLKEIFATGIVLGTYLAVMTAVFFYIVHDTDFFSRVFGVHGIADSEEQLNSALYLQVSIISQALIFVMRSRSWSYVERPGILLMAAFLAAQLVATVIAVYAHWDFARINGVGWRWAGVIWIYSIVTYVPLDILKFFIRTGLTGSSWDNMLQNKTAFTTKEDYGKGEREARWAVAQCTMHSLQVPEATKNHHHEHSDMAEQAKKRAEAARLRELHTLKGHVESVVKLKGLDIETMQQHYTV